MDTSEQDILKINREEVLGRRQELEASRKLEN